MDILFSSHASLATSSLFFAYLIILIKYFHYFKKVRNSQIGSLFEICWKEKKVDKIKDKYSLERKEYYKQLGWESKDIEEIRRKNENLEEQIIFREQDKQRSWEDKKIKEARYNIKYKDIDKIAESPSYLHKDNIDNYKGEDIRAIIRFRCGNLEDLNKYWMNDEVWKCKFCAKGNDCIEHYVKDCEEVKGWFIKLGKNEEKISKELYNDELGLDKGEILRKLWKEKEKKCIRKN